MREIRDTCHIHIQQVGLTEFKNVNVSTKAQGNVILCLLSITHRYSVYCQISFQNGQLLNDLLQTCCVDTLSESHHSLCLIQPTLDTCCSFSHLTPL